MLLAPICSLELCLVVVQMGTNRSLRFVLDCIECRIDNAFPSESCVSFEFSANSLSGRFVCGSGRFRVAFSIVVMPLDVPVALRLLATPLENAGHVLHSRSNYFLDPHRLLLHSPVRVFLAT